MPPTTMYPPSGRYRRLRWRRSDRLDAAVDRYRDDDLAGVFPEPSAERVDRGVQGELGDGEHLKFPVCDMLEDLLQQPTIPLGLQPEIQVQVDHREGGTLGQCGQPQGASA